MAHSLKILFTLQKMEIVQRSKSVTQITNTKRHRTLTLKNINYKRERLLRFKLVICMTKLLLFEILQLVLINIAQEPGRPQHTAEVHLRLKQGATRENRLIL